MVKLVKPVVGAFAGVALCFSSTVASAAAVPVASAPVSVSPFVALSAYGTFQSQSAVCAAAAGTAGAVAATQGQTPVQGCVLPVLDTPPPVPVAEAPVVVGYAPPVGNGFGFGVGAIIAGLIAVAGLAAVLLSSKDHGRLPVTPD